jgi:hypothetical protein
VVLTDRGFARRDQRVAGDLGVAVADHHLAVVSGDLDRHPDQAGWDRVAGGAEAHSREPVDLARVGARKSIVGAELGVRRVSPSGT